MIHPPFFDHHQYHTPDVSAAIKHCIHLSSLPQLSLVDPDIVQSNKTRSKRAAMHQDHPSLHCRISDGKYTSIKN
jgi:hypothetical protein